MKQKRIPKVPEEMVVVFGKEGADHFIDFLNEVYSSQEEDVVKEVSGKFNLHVTREVSTLKFGMDSQFSEIRAEMQENMSGHRQEMYGMFAELRSEMNEKIVELRGEMNEKFSELRNEMNEKFSGLRAEMQENINSLRVQMAELRAELKSDIAEIHKSIALQTKWILTVILAAATMISVLQPLMQKLLGL